MKYIRTKDDKIFLIHEDLDNKDLWYFERKEKTIVISCNPSDLGKVADNVEELCDRFVIEYKQHNKQRILKTYIKAERNFLRDKMYELNHIKKLYGAIWTDKGLIYVAKMNDKGELELL